MRKSLGIIMVLCLMVSFLSGCGFLADLGILKVNTERDYAQVIAEVKYDVNGVTKTRTVSKGELVEYFSSVGYTYVNSYGYSVEETLEILAEQLASQELLLLAAEELGITVDTMTNAEKKKAIEATNEQMQSAYESYVKAVVEERGLDDVDDDEEEETEEVDNRTPRPLPTEDEPEFDRDEPVADSDIPGYFFDTIMDRINAGDDCDNEYADKAAKKVALKRLEKALENNFRDYQYYLDKQYESIMIDRLLDSIYSSIDIKDKDSAAAQAAVQARYESLMLGDQEAYANNLSQYASDLSSNKNSIVYHPEKGFGYVMNLLITFSDDASNELNEFTNSGLYSDEAIAAKRDQLINAMTVDWYGEFVKPENEDAIDWRDDATVIEEDVNIFDFIAKVFDYCDDTTDVATRVEKFINMNYGYANVDGSFASSMLVKPSSKNDSTYVSEFQDLCNSLIEGTLIGDTKAEQIHDIYGEGAMGYCASRYGMHIVMVTYMPEVGANADGIVSLDKVVDYEKGTTLYDVIYDILYEAAKNDKEINYQQNFIEANEDCITYYSDRWANLLA